MSRILYIVVPCYNEQEVLPETSRRLLDKLNSLISQQKIDDRSRILFIDDGSRDNTWNIISALSSDNVHYAGVKLSRNRGHQNALIAGLSVAKDRCDAAVSLDADLQDDINAIDAMVDDWASGCDIVYGVRSSRDTDTAFKRITAKSFYRLMKLLGADIIEDHADYRLMSKRALGSLLQFDEVNLFLRGIVPQIGFKSSVVTYERHERFAGESKYPLKKMLMFAFDGITSFSVKPIRFVTVAGGSIFLISLVALVVLLLQKLFGYTVQGWATLMGSIWLLSGIQLLSLGVIGEYIGKLYQEAKHRPRFIIDEIKLK